MSYLSNAEYAQIQSSPESVWSIYQTHRTQFISDLGSAFSGQCENHIFLAFCCLVMFHWPYGASSQFYLRDVLNAAQLNCSNAVSGAWQLFLLIFPVSGTIIHARGWNGGPGVGNHVQLAARTPGSPNMYLDPTIGLFVNDCRAGDLIGHRTYTAAQMKSFYSTETKTPDIDSFNAAVISAIQNGTYDDDYQLYTGLTFSHFVRLSSVPIENWATPQALNCAAIIGQFVAQTPDHMEPAYMERRGLFTRVRGNGAGCVDSGFTSLPAGKTITITPSSLACEFRIFDTNGNAADVKAGYLASTANLTISPTPGSASIFVASSTPSANQIGISKAANNSVISIKNGFSAAMNLYIELDKDWAAAVSDPA